MRHNTSEPRNVERVTIVIEHIDSRGHQMPLLFVDNVITDYFSNVVMNSTDRRLITATGNVTYGHSVGAKGFPNRIVFDALLTPNLDRSLVNNLAATLAAKVGKDRAHVAIGDQLWELTLAE